MGASILPQFPQDRQRVIHNNIWAVLWELKLVFLYMEPRDSALPVKLWPEDPTALARVKQQAQH